MKTPSIALLSGLLIAQPVSAMDDTESSIAQTASVEAAAYVESHQLEILNEFRALLSLPNHARDLPNMDRNIEMISDLYGAEGFDVMPLSVPGATPSILATRMTPGATTTVLFYIHYDGQPVDESLWIGQTPYDPVLRAGPLQTHPDIIPFEGLTAPLDPDMRIYARSASDDKAPVIALLNAVRALDAAGIAPSVNIKVFFEGEEEMGSPNLARILEVHREAVAADTWVIFDGPHDQRGNPRVVLGVRGVVSVNVSTYGPNRGLHSGHYGNFAPDAVSRLAHVMTSMRDENGQVLMDGFYDEVVAVSAATEDMVANIPNADVAILESIGSAGREYEGLSYEQAIMIPSLNFLGVRAGDVFEKARNVIVPRATVTVGFRLVPDQSTDHLRTVVERHLTGLGYTVLYDRDPTPEERLAYERIARLDWGDGYGAVWVDADNPYAAATIDIMQQITDGETLVLPTLGGSLPFERIVETLDTDIVVVPIANQDNSQHAPNENIRLGHLWGGISIYASLLAAYQTALDANGE